MLEHHNEICPPLSPHDIFDLPVTNDPTIKFPRSKKQSSIIDAHGELSCCSGLILHTQYVDFPVGSGGAGGTSASRCLGTTGKARRSPSPRSRGLPRLSMATTSQ